MEVKLTYFKESGKFYTHAEYLSTVSIGYDFLVFEQVRTKQALQILPGLSSGTWEGYILVTPEEGVPALLDFTKK